MELRRQNRATGTWIWVAAKDWLNSAQSALAQGLVRGEWLTATHLADDKFMVAMCLSDQVCANQHVILTETNSEIASVSSVYQNLEFHEREMRQMQGLNFIGLKKDEPAFIAQFSGYPLRRDFALVPRLEIDWPGQVDPEKSAKRKTPPGVNAEWLS